MASKVYNAAKDALLSGGIDLDTDDIRAILVMSNTTADTENDAKVYVADLTTLDECDSSGYSRAALGSEAVNTDDANDRAEFDAADTTWASLAACTRQVIGVVLYKHVAADAANPLIAYIEFAAPVTPNGTDLKITWNAEGILQLA